MRFNLPISLAGLTVARGLWKANAFSLRNFTLTSAYAAKGDTQHPPWEMNKIIKPWIAWNP